MKKQLTIAALIIATAVTSFLTSCQTQNVASRYSSKYINANSGKITAQVPEAYELGYVMLALTDAAKADTAVVNQHSAYYNEVIAAFGSLKNSKGVQQLNADIARDPKMIKNYLDGLYALKMNGNRVVLKTDYRIDLNKVNFSRYALLLQDLYKQGNFHQFYIQHQDLYAQMVQKANTLFSYNEAKKAVDAQAQGYQIVLSPLTNGYAGTLQIKGHQYSECIVFPRMATDGRSYALNQNYKKAHSAE